MKLLDRYSNKEIIVELSGNVIQHGKLIDVGADIIVLYDGKDFMYIPILHIHKVEKADDKDVQISFNPSQSTQITNLNGTLSLRNVLNNARGVFSEIYVTKNQTIHGYVVSMMNNYFVFYSPVYKTMYISLQHLKWLVPYNPQVSPYALEMESLPVNPMKIPLARTFDEQIKKLINRMVIFDLGHDDQKIGQLRTIENNIVELITARQTSTLINVRHIKTIHLT